MAAIRTKRSDLDLLNQNRSIDPGIPARIQVLGEKARKRLLRVKDACLPIQATKAVLRSLQGRKIAVEVRLMVLYQSTALFAW
eukprot:scaffold5342_cov104-Cylindrotheca_fusiformis.AAC.1